MPGTFVIDSQATFANALMLTCAPKMQFGSMTAQEVNAQGVPKWTAEVAVTFHGVSGMKPVSEVITITITAPADPGQGIPPGTPITFEGFRVGATPPEKNDRGGIRGGKLWYQATALRPAMSGRPDKREAA